MEEAPKLYPAAYVITSYASTFNMNDSEITIINPSKPNPTTLIPITLPPLKATSNALTIPLSCAAVAVLELAFVALFIPIYPAAKLNSDPSKNAKAVPPA